MSTLPLDVKINTLNEVGNALDDVLESVRNDLHRAEGAHAAMTNALTSVAKLTEVIAVDLQAQRISAEHAEIARLWVARATQVVENLMRNHANSLFLARGAENQNSKIVKAIKSMYDMERARKDRISPEMPAPAEVPSDVPATAEATAADPEAPVAAVRKSPAPRTIKERRLAGQPTVVKEKRGRAKKAGN